MTDRNSFQQRADLGRRRVAFHLAAVLIMAAAPTASHSKEETDDSDLPHGRRSRHSRSGSRRRRRCAYYPDSKCY